MDARHGLGPPGDVSSNRAYRLYCVARSARSSRARMIEDWSAVHHGMREARWKICRRRLVERTAVAPTIAVAGGLEPGRHRLLLSSARRVDQILQQPLQLAGGFVAIVLQDMRFLARGQRVEPPAQRLAAIGDEHQHLAPIVSVLATIDQ